MGLHGPNLHTRCTQGATTSNCQWGSDTSLAIYPVADSNYPAITYAAWANAISVGDHIYPNGNTSSIIRALCRIPFNCTAGHPAVLSGPTHGVLIAPPTNPVLPYIVQSVAPVVGACDDLAFDMTSSYGHGGRPWAVGAVQVTSSHNSSATALQNFLSDYATSQVALHLSPLSGVIPSALRGGG